MRCAKIFTVTIFLLHFSEPGTIQFEKRGILVKESCGDAEISVIRQNGADGKISVKWKTIDKTAINGKDYKGGEGVIEFNHGEVRNPFNVQLSLRHYPCDPFSDSPNTAHPDC